MCRFWPENVYGGDKYDVTVKTHCCRRGACIVDVTAVKCRVWPFHATVGSNSRRSNSVIERVGVRSYSCMQVVTRVDVYCELLLATSLQAVDVHTRFKRAAAAAAYKDAENCICPPGICNRICFTIGAFPVSCN